MSDNDDLLSSRIVENWIVDDEDYEDNYENMKKVVKKDSIEINKNKQEKKEKKTYEEILSLRKEIRELKNTNNNLEKEIETFKTSIHHYRSQLRLSIALNFVIFLLAVFINWWSYKKHKKDDKKITKVKK